MFLSILLILSGTGKSLSIICSALQWLVDRKQKKVNSGSSSDDKVVVDGGEEDESEPDWIRNFTVVNDDKETIRNNRKHAKEKRPFQGGEVSVRKHEAASGGDDEVNEQEFCLEEYESEEDSSSSSSKRKPPVGGGGFYTSSEDDEEEDDKDEEGGLKVFYCSRTHSQLSQFVKELKKTVFAQNIRVVCLGSRKNMCINEGYHYIILFFFFLSIVCVCVCV